MASQCRYRYLSYACDERRIVLEDLGPWDEYQTITNAAEGVVAWLSDTGQLHDGRRLLYYDSEGDLAELVHHAGRLSIIAPPPPPGDPLVRDLPPHLEPRNEGLAVDVPGAIVHGASPAPRAVADWQVSEEPPTIRLCDDDSLSPRQADQLYTAIMGAPATAACPPAPPDEGASQPPAAGAVPRWQTMGQLADQLDQWAAELHDELQGLDARPPVAARASRLVFGVRVETELRFCASCVRRYLRAVADETAAQGS